jgi:heme o synthase
MLEEAQRSIAEKGVRPSTDRRIRYVLFTAALAAFFVIVMGNLVRVTHATQACPDWPTCYGQFGMPQGTLAQLQVIHRGLSGFLALITFISAGLVSWRYSRVHWISRPVYAAVILVTVQVFLGAGIVFNDATLLAPIHLGLALGVFALLLAATVAGFYHEYDQHGIPLEEENKRFFGDRLGFKTSFARLSVATTAAVFILMISGVLVTTTGAGGACAGLPLCGNGLPQTGLAWLDFSHRLITAGTSILILVLFLTAWRSQRSQKVQLTTATAAFVLFIGQVLLGAMKVLRGFPTDLVWLHAASAAALWGVLVVLGVSTGFSQRTQAEESEEAAQPLVFRDRLKDLFLLNKPIIVALLLVTTYAGMVLGARALPSFMLTFWTMLGGALAAGGASALNQYIDRETDKAMQRTAKRPLPAGRLMAAEGLAYGTGAVLLSFFLLAGFVNLIAGLLSLAGMVYYVLLYSIWLKRLTVQNIVIGGGAGAIPPLVGWAAASGSLNIPSLFLFAIVFMWTPPHFWALALVRKNDYARAGVPMLPVVKGEKVTRTQIFIYTLELVGLTLLMPLLKITGAFFLVSAAVLGAWMIYSAWQVLKKGGNKTAWKMYRYSSMYLAFLFLALVIDVLI